MVKCEIEQWIMHERDLLVYTTFLPSCHQCRHPQRLVIWTPARGRLEKKRGRKMNERVKDLCLGSMPAWQQEKRITSL